MKPLTIEEIQRRIQCRFPEESFTLIQYESLGKPGIVKCNNCNELISINKFSNFFAKTKAYGCKNCHGLWRKREQIINQLKEKYDILNTFVKDTHTYYQIKCKNCGHIRTTTLNNFNKNLACGCETRVYRNRTSEELMNEINKNSIEGTYSLVGEYINQTTPVLLRHSCGFIWKVRPADVVYGKSYCPKCGRKQSKMARYIETILKDNKIPYQAEYRLKDSLQRFDFYLENNKYKIAIEYNGLQHYKKTDFFSTTLEQQQERDNRKKEYCDNNGIILYVLPYTMTEQEIYNAVIDIINKFNDYPEREQN